jgi:predicted AAA+ superfamily ATPase
MLTRQLKLPESNHFFLFGPRQVGKTTLIKESFSIAETKIYNLLLSDIYSKFKSQPELFRQEVLALPDEVKWIVLDEAQRVPELLDEVQALIDGGLEKYFIITGSSARKIKRGQANLLGGRAWALNLYPLSVSEFDLTKVDLATILTYGTLPGVFTAKTVLEKTELLRAYVEVYLREEIELEALSRNIGGFIRFLSIVAQTNGEQINYSNVGKDVGISSVTVKEYYKILEDTLIGSFLFPFEFSERKKHKISPKFYLFDTGVLRSAQKRLSLEVSANTFEYGNYFETWVINEAIKISSYLRKDFVFSFLRTVNNVEVDLVIQTPSGKTLAVEIKSKKTPDERDFQSGFDAIKTLVKDVKCLCVCTGENKRLVGDCEVVHYSEFFRMLKSI